MKRSLAGSHVRENKTSSLFWESLQIKKILHRKRFKKIRRNFCDLLFLIIWRRLSSCWKSHVRTNLIHAWFSGTTRIMKLRSWQQPVCWRYLSKYLRYLTKNSCFKIEIGKTYMSLKLAVKLTKNRISESNYFFLVFLSRNRDAWSNRYSGAKFIFIRILRIWNCLNKVTFCYK